MKKIQAFVAEDGTLFQSAQECQLHERKLAFKKWYSSKPADRALIDADDNDLGDEYVCDWLFHNRIALLQFLQVEQEVPAEPAPF